MAILAPPSQFAVVVVTTDPRTPEQYNGLIATQQKAAAVSKGKGKIVPMLSDESNYGESSSEHEQESEEGELGVKVWGPLDVERLNSCFTGALSDCVYYSVHNNAIFVGADANWAAAFEYSSQQQAKMPTSVVYKFAPRGFPRTPYELERLYKHYANKHAPHHNRVVAYLLINKLLLVAQKLNESLLNKTMWALLHNPMYRDLQSPIQGNKDKDFVVPQHIPTCFTHVKEDGTIALHVMHALDPS
ncbi:hypothetical protein C0995_009775 [Termitomyces sp. Mi166|nr:hypothetical protein C0995_009775 [Termitomyces sp. Mi166\